MKFRYPLPLWFLASMLMALPGHAQDADASSSSTDAQGVITAPKVETSLVTSIPNDLKHLLIENPYVDFIVLINEEGKLKDSLPIASNHYDLLPAAQKVIDRAEFTAATLDGQTIPIRYQLRVSFRDYDQDLWQNTGKLPMGANVMDGAERKIYSRSEDKYIYAQTEVSELDAPLKIEEGALVVMEDDSGNGPQGSCTVEYYIDAEGRVKLPKVLRSDNDVVSLSALGSLDKIRFTKPSHNQTPTFVKVRQTFRYGEQPAE